MMSLSDLERIAAATVAGAFGVCIHPAKQLSDIITGNQWSRSLVDYRNVANQHIARSGLEQGKQ